MRRRHLVELEDLPWCPRAVRDGGTDWLAFMANATGMLLPMAPRIRAAMQAAGTTRILDLCSGGGGPWRTLAPELAKSGPIEVRLSDLYPAADAGQLTVARGGWRVAFVPHPVDATNVPPALDGMRTMFHAFHHFRPETARAILADAVRQRRAIGIFEGTYHRAVGLIAMPLQLPAILLFTPFVRPFKWSRLFLTYVLPLIPFIVLWDGIVSFLRLYSEPEMRELVASVPGQETFEWAIGSGSAAGLKLGPAFLIGTPRTGVRSELR